MQSAQNATFFLSGLHILGKSPYVSGLFYFFLPHPKKIICSYFLPCITALKALVAISCLPYNWSQVLINGALVWGSFVGTKASAQRRRNSDFVHSADHSPGVHFVFLGDEKYGICNNFSGNLQKKLDKPP